MRSHGDGAGSGAILGLTAALLALLVVAIAPVGAAAKNGPSNIAVGQIEQVPQGAVIFRFLDLTIPEGQPPVEHSLGPGFIHVVEGMHLLVQGNEQQLLAPGGALWISPGEQIKHAASIGSASHFWFIQLSPVMDRGTPPAWPYPYSNASIFAESPDFRATGSAPYSLVLTDVLLDNPGDTVDSLGQVGPAAVVVVQGQVSVGQQKFPPKVLLQLPSDSRPFFNRGTGPARLLAVRLIPAGMPLELLPSSLPATGEVDGRVPVTWRAWIAGSLLLAVAKLVRRTGVR